MKLKSAKAFVQEVAIILIGCFLTAFAVDCILKPSGLAVTGVTGVAMVLEHFLSFFLIYSCETSCCYNRKVKSLQRLYFLYKPRPSK